MSEGLSKVLICAQAMMIITRVEDFVSEDSASGRTSMKTVPFSLGPLQYWAGNDELLVQSGCRNS